LTEAVSYPVRLVQSGGLLQYGLILLLTLASCLGYFWFRQGASL
jgi:hypothetical protein